MTKGTLCLTVLLLGSTLALGREPKEYDSNVIYDESKVPRYDLPPLLVTAEGKPVTTAAQWRNVRRPQILSLFSNLVYGRVPEPESPIETEFEVKRTDPKFMGGRATRKDVQIRFRNDKSKAEMLVLVFVPNKATRPVPAFMKHSFNDTKSHDFDAHPLRRGCLRNGWPLGEFFDRGYAFVAVYQQDLVGHNEVEFLRGIHPLFYKKGQSFPKAHEWGVLSVVAWGAMRAMDYLESDSDIDPTRVAIMGHSKMGKATLWTAAQDERFAMAISAQSGCAGAALWRRRSGETLEKMVTRFPYWLCRNAWKFVNREDDLPVDQHMLLACIAPRPVYVHSGVEDTWADGRGEYLSAYHASEVYRLLGKKGLTSKSLPPVGEAIIESDVGYHIREGGHSIKNQDWQHFLDFADYHLKRSMESEGEVAFTKQVEVFGLHIYATSTTGDKVFRVERDEKSNWATPYVWQNTKRTELVTCGTGRIRSYDLDGTLLWELGPMSVIAIPTPVQKNGLLYICSGYVGDRKNRPVYAIRPGASGDITPKDEQNTGKYIAWYRKLSGPYNPSPIAYGDYLYILYDRGAVSCYDGRTGDVIYEKQQLAKDARAFTASPWANDGKLFFLSEDGDTFVVQAGPEFRVLGRNAVNEMCMATPATLRGSVIIRTLTKLYRIGQ